MIWIRINDMRFREKDRHLQNDPKRTLSFAHSLLDEERRGKWTLKREHNGIVRRSSSRRI